MDGSNLFSGACARCGDTAEDEISAGLSHFWVAGSVLYSWTRRGLVYRSIIVAEAEWEILLQRERLTICGLAWLPFAIFRFLSPLLTPLLASRHYDGCCRWLFGGSGGCDRRRRF